MQRSNGRSTEAVRGWLWLLCFTLLAWGPMRLALVASNSLSALTYRGRGLAFVLVAAALVTALGVAAGLALAARRTLGVPMAKAALLASAALDAFIYATPYVPSNRMPGDTPYYAAASLAYHA